MTISFSPTNSGEITIVKLSYACPKCDATVHLDVEESTRRLVCSHCAGVIDVAADALTEGRQRHCLACPSEELYVRKDFPQRLGVAIIVTGFLVSTVSYYYYMYYISLGVLFGTALIDVFLYAVVGNMLQCYRCDAQYHDLAELEGHKAFDLETHEKYRQMAAREQDQAAVAAAEPSDDQAPEA